MNDSKPDAEAATTGDTIRFVLSVVSGVCLLIAAATTGVAAEPTVRDAQTADGLPETVEVTFDSALEIGADADEADLAEAFDLDADTEADAAIDTARIGDPETTVVLELTAPIVPQDGDLEEALSFDNGDGVLIAAADELAASEPAASFEDETVENNLISPQPTAATVPDGTPDAVRIVFDESIEPVDADGNPIDGDDSDLGDAFTVTDTATDTAVPADGVTVTEDTLTLSLTAPITPADTPTVELRQFSDDPPEAELRATDDVAVADFTTEAANDLSGPTPETATTPAEQPETITVTFSEPIEIDGDADALTDAFDLTAADGANLATDPTVEAVSDADADDTVTLALSAPLGPVDDPRLSFAPLDAVPTLLVAAADGVPAEGVEELTVENNVSGPTPETAVVPAAQPQTVTVSFSEAVVLDGDGDDLIDAFEVTGADETKLTADPTIEAVSETDADDAIELSLSAPLFPTDSPSISFTPDDAASPAILIAAVDGVPAEELDALAVDNDLTGPAIQEAAVSADDPDTVRIVLDEPIELVDDTDEADLIGAFELDADTDADAAIESISVVDNSIEISLSAEITATDGDDGTIENALSFEQTAIGAPLRGATTGVAVADFTGLALRNEVAIEDPDVPPFDPDPDPSPGGGGGGGGVVTGPPDRVSQGTAEIVSDVEPASPGTTFRIEPTNLIELRFAAVEDGTGILGVDELRGLSPADPSLGDRPFVTAFEIDVPEGLETQSATLLIRVPDERLRELTEETGREIGAADLVVLRVDNDGFVELETTVVDETDEAVLLEAQTPQFSRFVVTAFPADPEEIPNTGPTSDDADLVPAPPGATQPDPEPEPGSDPEPTDTGLGALAAALAVAALAVAVGLLLYRQHHDDDDMERL